MIREKVQQGPTRILRLPEVCAITGLSKYTIGDGVRNGWFPAPVKIGGGTINGWLENELQEYFAKLVADREKRKHEPRKKFADFNWARPKKAKRK